MKAKPLYNRICNRCGVLFQSPQKSKQLCPTCEAEAKKRSKQAWRENNRKPRSDKPLEEVKKPVLSFRDIGRIQKQYYDVHRKFLKYGEVVDRVRTGAIKVVMGKDGAEYVGEQ